MIGYTLFVVNLLLQVIGQLLLKAGANGSTGWVQSIWDWRVVVGVGILGVNMLVWLAVLRHFNLSYIYPLGAMLYVLIALGSVAFLREELTWIQWAGIGLVVVGVILLGNGAMATPPVE